VTFNDLIQKASQRNRSKIVLALDLENSDRERLAEESKKILENVSNCICAVKINRQLVLSLGLRGGVDSVVKLAHDFSLPAIMDAKLNDVGHTNEFMLRSYIDVGFDAVIASPTSGWEGGLDSVFSLATSHGKGVILLVYMSNPGAEDFYSLAASSRGGKATPIFEMFANMAVERNADGVIVGATKPAIVSRVRELVGPKLAIFSPGVGVQGGDARKALDGGSNYLIVGRSIYTAGDPAKAAEEFRAITA
jgi:orotidine-5'-phosphate decarboxylase